MRRVLIIVAGAIVLIGLLIAAYFVFFASRGPSLVVDEPNPFDDIGSGDVEPVENPEDTGDVTSDAGTQVAPRLIQVTEGPVAHGAVAFPIEIPGEEGSGTTTVETLTPDTEVRYVERASGNVYAYRAHERTLARLSNKTVPGVAEASWLSDGTFAYVRFGTQEATGDIIETYALPAYGDGGYFLERGLAAVLTQGTDTLFSLLSTTSGSTGTVANSDGTGARTVFSSPLSAITVGFAGDDFVAYTKPSAHLEGYGFLISAASGAFSRIAGPRQGLSMLPSPSGAWVLYTYVERGTLRMEVLDTETRTVTTLPIATLSEKCAWTADELTIYCAVPKSFSGTLPDDWYQGGVSFTDRIWAIDLEERVAVLIIDPMTTGDADIDAVALTLDGASDVLVFTNKKDGSLWVYDL